MEHAFQITNSYCVLQGEKLEAVCACVRVCVWRGVKEEWILEHAEIFFVSEQDLYMLVQRAGILDYI